MRGRRGNGDAGLPDLEPAHAMMQRQTDGRPPVRDLGRNALERPPRERFVRFVLEISDAPAQVAVPDQAQKCRHGAVGPLGPCGYGADRRHQRLEGERLGSDREQRDHSFSIRGYRACQK